MQHTEYTLILVLSVFNNTRPVKERKPAPVTNFPGLWFGQRGSPCDGWVTPFFQAGIDLNDIGSTFRAIRQCIDFAVSDGVSIDDSATLLPLVQTNLRGIVSPAIADNAPCKLSIRWFQISI